MAKNNQDNQVQNVTLCMQYVFFEKGIYMYYIRRSMGSRVKPPEAGEFPRTYNCKLQKENWGLECITCSPNNFVGCSPTPAVSAPTQNSNSANLTVNQKKSSWLAFYGTWNKACFVLSCRGVIYY